MTKFIDLTLARTGESLIVNTSTIIDVEGLTYASPRDGAPNITFSKRDPGHHFPMGAGSFVTIRGRRKEENPAMVEQTAEQVAVLIREETEKSS